MGRTLHDIQLSIKDEGEREDYMKKKKNKKHAVFRYIRKNLTVILMILMVLVTVGTFAWFSVSNSPRVQNLALVADHEGNLMIADDVNGTPGTYSDVLDLKQATGYDYMQSVRLSPVTTANGKEFYSPNYDAATNTVGSVSLINDHSTLINSYIYEKTFYLKASSGDGTSTSGTTYNVALAGGGSGGSGTYILKDTSAAAESDSSAYATRISFTVTDASGSEVTKIYEPNYDVNNNSDDMAVDGVKGNNGYGTYTTIQQKSDGTFVTTGTGTDSEILFTIPDNTDVKVTMRVWLEGTDEDCANSIGATLLTGQIQFSSSEVTGNN